jgi:hypothetical protein
MKALRSFETSGMNTPAATLHWIYFSFDKAVRNTGFQTNTITTNPKKKSKECLCLSVCMSPDFVISVTTGVGVGVIRLYNAFVNILALY